MRNTELTLIIPAYNEQAELPKSLHSLAGQKDPNFNLVLVNNSSPDATPEIMRDFQRVSPNTRVVDENKVGKLNALKTGLAVALNEFKASVIAFSDADSVFDAHWSEAVKQLFESQPDIAFGYGTELHKPERVDEVPTFWSCLQTYTDLLRQTRSRIGGYMNLGNCYVRRDAFEAVGGFDETWTKSLDTLLTLKLLGEGFKGEYCDARIWFSPRRLLDNGNIAKWCSDEDIRQFVKIGGISTWKPVRVDDPKYTDQQLVDITLDQYNQAIGSRTQRLFRRLLILTIFDNTQQQIVLRRMGQLLLNGSDQELLSKWLNILPAIKQAVFKHAPLTLERYQFADNLVREHFQDFIDYGGKLLLEKLQPKAVDPAFSFAYP